MLMRTPGRWALAGLALSVLMPSLDTSVTTIALPTLVGAFAASFREVQWVVLAYLLSVTASIVTAGRLGDIVGRRRLLLSGVALFTTASVAGAAAPTLWLLVAARAVQGLGAAVMMSLAVALVSEVLPREHIGRGMGLLGAMSAVGTMLGPSIGGVLMDALGWRAIFLLNLPLGLLNALLAYRFLPRGRSPLMTRTGLDTGGTLLMASALCSYALAMTMGRGRFGWLNVGLLLVAGAAGWLFARQERRAAAPLVPFSMFRARNLTTGLTLSSLVSAVMMATLVVGPFYLSRTLGLTTWRAGLVMSAGPLVAALAGVPAGRLVDRLGSSLTTATGLVGMATGCLMLSLLPTSGVFGYVGPIALVTAGYALFQAANNTMVMTGIATDERGVVAGLLTLSRSLGLITGAAALGAVFMYASGAGLATASASDVARGMRTTFGVVAMLLVSALVISLYRKRRPMRLRSAHDSVDDRMLA